MTYLERVPVLVEPDGLYVDGRESLINSPWVPGSVVTGIAEGVVVVHLVEGGVEVVVAIDVRGVAREIIEDERDGEGEDPAPPSRPSHGLEERPRQPAGLNNVGEERISGSAEAEE